MRRIPQAFLDRMRALPDFDCAAFERALQEEPRRGLRVNTLKISAAEFAALSPFALTPSPLCPEGFLIDAEAPAGKHPYHAAGLYYLQEPSAQSAVTALDPAPGSRVLDLCAAPGGKAAHAAARIAPEGLLVANECVPNRARTLSFNLERMGVRRCAVTTVMPEALVKACPGWFDAVIADVPCSGEGMFRREPQALEEWSLSHAAACAERGKKILADAAALVRPGGTLLFSTCTFNPDENEGAVEFLLRQRPDFEVLSIDAVRLPPARPDWAGARPELARAARLMLTDAPGEGHFIARLRRTDGETPAEPPACGLKAPKKEEQAAFEALWRDTFREAPFGTLCVTPKGEIFLVPEGLPALPGLLRAGVHAGTLKTGRSLRFEPSHTLFMAMPAAAACRSVCFEPEDPALAAFFAGETLQVPEDAGYAAVCVRAGEGAYPVGMGKVSGGQLKNHLPTGLRVR